MQNFMFIGAMVSEFRFSKEEEEEEDEEDEEEERGQSVIIVFHTSCDIFIAGSYFFTCSPP